MRRSIETDSERSARLEQDAASKANNRVCESHEQKEMRRSRDIARHNRKRRRDSTAVVPCTDDIAGIGTKVDSSWRSRNTNAFKQKVQANLVRFHREISTLHFPECDVCREAWPSMKVCVQGELSICNRCQRDKGLPKLFSIENNAIPGPVPECLARLSVVEEMLIAQIMPMMQTYILPYGQYGYKGHVICLPQDVQSVATALPRTGRSVGVVVIRRKGKSGGHRDFRVRRAVVLEALRWLIRNNHYYSNVTIDYDVVDALPEDGTLSDLQVIEDDDLARLDPNDDANVDEQSQQEGSSSSGSRWGVAGVATPPFLALL